MRNVTYLFDTNHKLRSDHLQGSNRNSLTVIRKAWLLLNINPLSIAVNDDQVF